MGVLSGLSFAQDFPVNVTAPAPQYTIKVDGQQVDSLKFDFGDVKKGESRSKYITYSIFSGETNATSDVQISIAKSSLESNVADVKLSNAFQNAVPQRGIKDPFYKLKADFIAKAEGKFSQNTTLAISKK